MPVKVPPRLPVLYSSAVEPVSPVRFYRCASGRHFISVPVETAPAIEPDPVPAGLTVAVPYVPGEEESAGEDDG